MKRNIRNLTKTGWKCDGNNLHTDNKAHTHIATFVVSPLIGKQGKAVVRMIEAAPKLATMLAFYVEAAADGHGQSVIASPATNRAARELLASIGVECGERK